VEPTFFPTPADLRQWLEANHDNATELLVGLHKKGSGNPSITWPELVDEVLCYGWIDGVRKSRDESSYTIRITPRKPRSIWSAINIKRAHELIDEGRMCAAGLAAFEARDEERSRLYSYEQRDQGLGEAYETELRARPKAWEFFQAQAPWYRRAVGWWVASAKREDTRQRRLAILVESSENGRRIDALTPRRSGS
jgi:uncharacterized protein YdeI (YjbR/CyaY-like superfamily)